LTTGSRIRNRFFPDPGSRIPDPKTIFWRAFWQFLGVKSSIILWKLADIFFFSTSKPGLRIRIHFIRIRIRSHVIKTKIIFNFVTATKERGEKKFDVITFYVATNFTKL
jgi:hypothetical protein